MFLGSTPVGTLDVLVLTHLLLCVLCGLCGSCSFRANAVSVAPGSRHWQIFTDLCRQTEARGNIIADAYLAALAIESGCEWISTDRDYARFPDLKWRHPLE
ncbi:MAG: PIN domain-containing protein [Planctomycetaceae bacterium]